MPLDSRPFTPEEQRLLVRLAARRRDLFDAVFGAAFVYLLALFIVFGALHLFFGPPRGAALAVAAVLTLPPALAIFLRLRRGLEGGAAGGRELHAADLAAGRAERETLEVREAVRVAEREDEGATFYLRLADGAVVFLSGQYLDEAVEEGRFPSTRVVVTRAPRSRIVLDVECVGQALPARATRPPFTPADRRAGRVPADGARLALDFESLDRR